MKGAERFFDTNVLLYLLSGDQARADRAEELLAGGGVVSVQVLNEFVSVAMRKLAMTLPEVRDVLAAVRTVCSVEPLSVETHEHALALVERYRFSIYDASILAAALRARCRTLYSEDMQHGQVIEERLRIRDPFAGGDS
ncbi:MAG TPA: PIN domain-containing protein [Geminicoccaceae bacterium]|nr:PIN domain-containing protein [Geminicoccaceae bacterium]